MVKIYMANVHSALIGLSKEDEIKLSHILSYTTGGFGVPTQNISLFDTTNHSTYTGLIPRVIQYLIQNNIPYEVNDMRNKPESNAVFSIKGQARDYQQEIIDRVTSREIIQAATGAGKTFIMASLIAKFNVKPIIVIAPKVSLAEQIKNEFEKFLGVHIGIVGGGNNDIQDITICTPLSASDELLESAKMIMFDECHNIPANGIFSCANKAKNAYYRIGVSATPWRDGGDDLVIEAILSIRRPNLSINASSLIAKGKLTPCNIVFIPVKGKYEWCGSYANLYERAIVRNAIRNNMIKNLSIKMLEQKRTILILIKNIEHGDLISSLISKEIKNVQNVVNIEGKSIKVNSIEFLSGKNTEIERKAILQGVKEDKVQILIGSTIADEGLDLPKLDCLILAGSGKSSTRAFQRIGRVLRLYENKKDAIIFDFIDETKTFNRHALIRKALYETEPLWNIKELVTKTAVCA